MPPLGYQPSLIRKVSGGFRANIGVTHYQGAPALYELASSCKRQEPALSLDVRLPIRYYPWGLRKFTKSALWGMNVVS